jgi:hypothetical protein
MSVWVLTPLKVGAPWITCQPADLTRFGKVDLTSPEATFVPREYERRDAVRAPRIVDEVAIELFWQRSNP